jgi:very-short-patch-repair endonuclease
VRAILQEADHRLESPGESILGHRLRQLGWEVVPQFEVETDQGPRFADFRIPGTRVLIEFDGLVKYRGEDGADAVVAEKVREDAMRRRGFLFARFIWSELDDLHLIDRRVREQVDESAAA